MIPLRLSLAALLLAESLLGYPTQAIALPVKKAVHFQCRPELPNKYWTVAMSKAYTHFILVQYKWNTPKQYSALIKLWSKESQWNPLAYNKQTESHHHAGGIPQILGMSTSTPAPLQIARGLSYIKHRYGKPTIAWQHHRTYGWY